ncbi:MAG: hypothetical protein RL026_2753 [Pseudomonadota bacterium]
MRPMLRSALPALALGLGLMMAASGCVYRMAIRQGNFLDEKQVSQLETGMTRSQVAFLLGTPMVPNGFDRDRWDYLYYLQDRKLEFPDSRRLTVYFEDDKVARMVHGPDTGKAPHIGAGAGF